MAKGSLISAKSSSVSKSLNPKNRGFKAGSHGFKKKEQRRLSRAAQKVTGDTHESEHTIGFEPLNRSSGEKRGKGIRSRYLENVAPAYQEQKAMHRAHIGTGSNEQEDHPSGFKASTYRQTQRTLVEDGNVGDAVQINQLGYAYIRPTLQKSVAADQADDSFNVMVENMHSVTYADGPVNKTVMVTAKQRAEMHLSRQVVLTKRYPTLAEENIVRKKYGLDPVS